MDAKILHESPTKIKIMISLADRPLNRNQISRRLKLNWRTIDRHLRYLVSSGLVREVRYGKRAYFSLTERGKGVLKELLAVRKWYSLSPESLANLLDDGFIAVIRWCPKGFSVLSALLEMLRKLNKTFRGEVRIIVLDGPWSSCFDDFSRASVRRYVDSLVKSLSDGVRLYRVRASSSPADVFESLDDPSLKVCINSLLTYTGALSTILGSFEGDIVLDVTVEDLLLMNLLKWRYKHGEVVKDKMDMSVKTFNGKVRLIFSKYSSVSLLEDRLRDWRLSITCPLLDNLVKKAYKVFAPMGES